MHLRSLDRVRAAISRSRADLKYQPTPRQVAEQVVDVINPGPEWDVAPFVRQLSLDRKRPIRVRTLALPVINQQITGQLWRHQHYDEILVADNLTAVPDEAKLVVCHEVGHLLFDHIARVPIDALAQQFWIVPPDLVRKRLEGIRSCSTAGVSPAALTGGDGDLSDDPLRRSEAEAEWFATLLLSRAAEARRRVAAATRTSDSQTDPNKVVHRIAEVFGYL